MAVHLSPTDLNDIQEVGGIDEKRFPSLGLVDAVKDSTPFIDFISPSKVAEMNKITSQRNVKFPAIKDQDVTVTNVASFNIPANLPESADHYAIAIDIASGFRFYPASYEDNAIDMQWEKMRRIKAVTYAMGKYKEGLIQTAMETYKTQVFGGSTTVSAASAGTLTFNTGTDTLDVSLAAQTDTMFINVAALFDFNEVGGNLRYVSSRAGFQTQIVNALKYGAGNDKNLQALGLPDPSRYYQSSTLVPASDVFNGYVFRDGAIGLIENFPYDYRANTNFAGKEWTVSDMENPYTRSRLNVFVNTEATDGTALVDNSNMQMTHFQEMAFRDRFFIVVPYNSDRTTRASDILKIKGATS